MDVVPVILVAFVVIAVVCGYVQMLRGRSAGKTSNWEIRTTLQPYEIEVIVMRGLKGANPLARVKGGLDEGGCRRRIRRWAYDQASSAEIVVGLLEDEEEELPGVFVVRGEITEWQMETIMGMANPFLVAPLAARRRLRAIHKQLVQA